VEPAVIVTVTLSGVRDDTWLAESIELSPCIPEA
jgi:hypothetical protein